MITLTVLNKNQYALFNRIQLPAKKAKHFCLLKTTNPGFRGKHSNYNVNQLLKSYIHVCFVNLYCENKTVCRLIYCKRIVHFVGLIEVNMNYVQPINMHHLNCWSIVEVRLRYWSRRHVLVYVLV